MRLGRPQGQDRDLERRLRLDLTVVELVQSPWLHREIVPARVCVNECMVASVARTCRLGWSLRPSRPGGLDVPVGSDQGPLRVAGVVRYDRSDRALAGPLSSESSLSRERRSDASLRGDELLLRAGGELPRSVGKRPHAHDHARSRGPRRGRDRARFRARSATSSATGCSTTMPAGRSRGACATIPPSTRTKPGRWPA